MPIPKSMICECKRCGHEWIRRTEALPIRCPNCKSPYWNKERGELPMGRPPASKKWSDYAGSPDGQEEYRLDVIRAKALATRRRNAAKRKKAE